jgi:hypothetical protein
MIPTKRKVKSMCKNPAKMARSKSDTKDRRRPTWLKWRLSQNIIQAKTGEVHTAKEFYF